MEERIILCGGNGAGKSTLGRRLAERLGWPFFDIETYYFPAAGAEDPYEAPRTREEAAGFLLADLRSNPRCILAAVKGSYGPEVEGLFTCAVLLSAPRELRLERVRRRSYQRFGDRMLPGGDLWEREERFFRTAESFSPRDVEAWLETVDIPVLWVDAAGDPALMEAAVVCFLEGRAGGGELIWEGETERGTEED